jgi:hypothetical protein
MSWTNYSRWYDLLGIITSEWLQNCLIETNTTTLAQAFKTFLILFQLFCILHIGAQRDEDDDDEDW